MIVSLLFIIKDYFLIYSNYFLDYLDCFIQIKKKSSENVYTQKLSNISRNITSSYYLLIILFKCLSEVI